MSKPFHQFGLRVISGQNRSLLGFALRAGMAVIEPFYAIVTRLRNWCFDHRLKRAYDLGRPTISVGNITTGGTGKTPVVIWLANQLRDRGYRPAVLLRGYGSTHSGISDEQQLLNESLNSGSSHPIPVMGNPSRVASAAAALLRDPSIDLFILDDGFQHRKAKRNFDLVLVSATEPFGYGHVLPRGLLREPLSGLKRATAFVITRSSQADLSTVSTTLARINSAAPVFRSDHVHSEVWIPSSDQHLPIATLAGEKVFVFAGIGDPEPFARQLLTAGCNVVVRRWFADHHPYSANDIEELTAAATQSGATWLLTTRKDWVKLAPLVQPFADLKIGVVSLSIAFLEADESAILDYITTRSNFRRIHPHPSAS